MKTSFWHIYNVNSGCNLGVYPGATAAEALDAMAVDAGYDDFSDYAQWAEGKPMPRSDFFLDECWLDGKGGWYSVCGEVVI